MKAVCSKGFFVLVAVGAVALLFPAGSAAQWSKEPGDTVRNDFGPVRSDRKPHKICRGACGPGCPSTCEESVHYECRGTTQLTRVRVYDCGSHQGCREHDDCLDACTAGGTESDCDAVCHQEAIANYGLENSVSWLAGHGPYDGPPITFEYSRDQPGASEAAYRCPEGSTRDCGDGAAGCVAAGGVEVAPIFDAYPDVDAGSMLVSNLRSGPLCDEGICEQDHVIRVTGEEACERGSCTRFGIEFDYVNADPSTPLECASSDAGGGDDYLSSFFAQGLASVPTQDDSGDKSGDEAGDGLSQLLGAFSQVMKAAQSGEAISIAPLGEDGKPVESERVHLQSGPAPVPSRVDLPAAAGHMVVPMYQLAESESETLIREIRCSHRGVPVLETAFELRRESGR